MLWSRAFKKSFFYIFIVFLVVGFSSRFWDAQPLIVALPNQGYIDATECLIPFLLVIPLAFLLYDNFEIELGLVCGVKTAKLMMTKVLAYFVYAVIPMVCFVFLYKYEEYVPINGAKIKIPIHIPENYRLYMLISVLVTMFFFAAIIVFFRVLTRNCYVPVIMGLFFYMTFSSLNQNIHDGRSDIRQSLFDPFISNYIISDHIPNNYYIGISGMQNIWTYNRLLFFGIGVVLFVLSYLLLRREKLHEGFGE